jgi:hypothetical protein
VRLTRDAVPWNLVQLASAATIDWSSMYEKPKVRDYGDLTELTAVVTGGEAEEVGIKSNNTKVG